MAPEQKTEQEVTDKKASSISPEIQKHLQGILATTGGGGKNKYGHLTNAHSTAARPPAENTGLPIQPVPGICPKRSIESHASPAA